MAKRLISFRELDEIEGDAAQFDTPAQDLSVLVQKEAGLNRDLVALLGRILERVRK